MPKPNEPEFGWPSARKMRWLGAGMAAIIIGGAAAGAMLGWLMVNNF